MYLNLTGLDVSIHLAFALLPALRPEPPLVGWDGNMRMELDDSIVALDDLDLRAWLIKVVTTTKPSWERDGAAILNADVDGCHGQEDITALRYCSRTALRNYRPFSALA